MTIVYSSSVHTQCLAPLDGLFSFHRYGHELGLLDPFGHIESSGHGYLHDEHCSRGHHTQRHTQGHKVTVRNRGRHIECHVSYTVSRGIYSVTTLWCTVEVEIVTRNITCHTRLLWVIGGSSQRVRSEGVGVDRYLITTM